MNPGPSDHVSWPELVALAHGEVRRTLSALPQKLQGAVEALPVSYEHRPNAGLRADGIEPDTLGLFVGGEFVEGNHAVLPAQIILFLDNLWEQAEGDPEWFREEVHTTVLHELGHYLGLNEADLEARGLE